LQKIGKKEKILTRREEEKGRVEKKPRRRDKPRQRERERERSYYSIIQS